MPNNLMTVRQSLASVLLAACCHAPGLQAAAPGALDPAFDNDGRVLDDFHNATKSVVSAILQQPDGKLVVAGYRRDAGDRPDMAIARYNSDGTRDTSFSGDGRQTVLFAGGRSWAEGLARDSNNRMLLAGSASNGSNLDIALVRINTDGSVDNGLGSNGGTITNIGGSNDGAYAVVAQSDGRIRVAGYSDGSGSNHEDFALVGYKSNGELDTGFGVGGKVVTHMGGADAAFAMVQQPDNRLVLAGYTEGLLSGSRQFAAARYTAQGKLDSTFSGDGKITTSFGLGSSSEAHSVLRLGNGKLLLVGCSRASITSDADVAMARYNADGTLDTGFASNGLRTTDVSGGNDCAYAAIQQYDGKLLLAGHTDKGGGNDDFLLVRYSSNGTLDTSFGTNGKVTVSVGGGTIPDRSYAAVQQADGQVVAAGTSGNQLAMVRYLFDDDDNDGVTDDLDNCQYVPNTDQANHDDDAMGDACDDDDDNDGVKDASDAFPLDPAESVDTDGDGIGNNADPDDDNDGVLDGDDPFPLDPFLLNRVSGLKKTDYAGYSVALADDVNGDGYADVLVGAPQADVVLPPATKAASNVGAVYLSSGKTLEILHTFSGVAKGDKFGTAVAVIGDVDNDGTPDFAVGAPFTDELEPLSGKVIKKDRGSVTVYSGATYAALYTVHGETAGDQFGRALAAAGDVDSDGRGDFVAGAWKFDATDSLTLKLLKDAGAAYLYSGQAGTLLHRYTGAAQGDYFGFSVAGGADLNHDSVPEVVVGAYRFDPTDPVTTKRLADAGAVYAFSAVAPFAEVVRLNGAAKGDYFGYAVAVLNDGLDAFADVLAGAPRAEVTSSGGKKLTNAGRAHLFDDASGGAALAVESPAPQANAGFGSAVAAAGDVDAANGPDFVVGAPKADVTTNGSKLTDAGQFSAHQASSGNPVFLFNGRVKKGQAGFALAGGADHNLDGYDDVVVGAPYATFGGLSKAGTAEAISGKEASAAGP